MIRREHFEEQQKLMTPQSKNFTSNLLELQGQELKRKIIDSSHEKRKKEVELNISNRYQKLRVQDMSTRTVMRTLYMRQRRGKA